MRNIRVLSTVSAIALSAGVTMSAQASTSPNLIVDLASATIATNGAPVAIITGNDQINAGGSITSTAMSIVIGFPPIPGASEDIGGSANTVDVNDNTIASAATGNSATTEADNALATGVSPNNGVIAGSLQENISNTISSLSDQLEIRIDVIDAGPDDSLSLQSNTISAETIGNTSITSVGRDYAGGAIVTGEIPLGYSSGEEGQVVLSTDPTATPPLEVGAGEFEAAASYLAGNVQLNDGITTSATVSTARIGLDVNTDGGQDVEGTPMVVNENLINATLTGNDAFNVVEVNDGEGVALDGSVAVANLQINTGGDAFDASVTGATIRATVGDSNNATDGDMVGSNLTFTNNEISSSSQGNQVVNTIDFAPTISQNGPTTEQANEVTFNGVDFTNTQADMIISTAQINDVDVTSTISSSNLSVDTEGLLGSSVVMDNNTISSFAGANDAINLTDIEGAPTFDSSFAANNLQYATGDTTSTNTSNIFGDFAGEGQDFIESSASVDSNTISTDAIGNAQTTSISIAGTNIVPDKAISPTGIVVDLPNTTGNVTADLSVLSTQVLDGDDGSASVTSTQNSSIIVDFTDDSADFLSSEASVSSNNLTVSTIGNLSRETSLTIAGTNVSATAGVANVQVIEDGVLLSAVNNSGGNTDHIDIDIGAATITDVSIAVDDNQISSTLYGNLADGSTNALHVTGTTISDGGETDPFTTVDRSAGGVPLSTTTAGYTVANDQSIQDLGTVVVATVSADAGDEDLINLNIEGSPNSQNGVATITTSSISMSENLGLAMAQLNSATSELVIDAEAGLNASGALTNTQSVVAENTAFSLDGISVILMGGYEMNVFLGGDITDSSIAADDNVLRAFAGLNEATNLVSVSATTQTIEGVETGSAPSLVLGSNTDTDSEISLVNDQYFESLGGDVDVNIDGGNDGRGVEIEIGGNNTGDLVRSPVTADRNVIDAAVEANVASNEIVMDVGAINLDDADSGGGTRRGPVATIASNQRGLEGGEFGFSASVTGAGILIDADVVTNIEQSSVSANDNVVSAFGRVNAVENTLEVEGTTFISDGDATTPTAFIVPTTPNGGDLEFANTSFAIGSRQENAFDVTAMIDDSDVVVNTEVDSVTQSSLTANGNVFVAQARGSDSVNTGGADFGTNEANFFVGNIQLSTDDVPEITADVTGTNILVTAAQSNAVGGATVIDDSAISVDENAVLALASANRTDQSLDIAGTNVYTSYDGTPLIDASPPATREVTADYAIVNSQGSTSAFANEGDIVTATVNSTTIEFDADTVLSGALSADLNSIIAGGVLDSASNALTITALANVGVGDDTPSSAVYSRQMRTNDSSVFAGLFGVQIGSIGSIGSISSSGGVGISIDANVMGASATIGSAINSINVVAGASINGNSAIDPHAEIGTGNGFADTLNADHSVYNQQHNFGADSTAVITDGFQIGTDIGSSAVNDAISIDGNLIQAIANGFVSENSVTLSAGSESAVTAQVGNEQYTEGAEITATILGGGAGVDGIGVSLDGGLFNSASSVSGNSVLATAQTNQTVNVIASYAEATMQNTDGASLALTPGGFGTQALVDDADLAILNVQTSVDGLTTASISGLGIGVGIDGALNEASIAVNNNNVQATAIGNDAVNAIVINAGAPGSYPSAALGNVQINENQIVSASVSGVNIGASGTTASSTSNISVSGNSVGATAIGNRSFNSIGQ